MNKETGELIKKIIDMFVEREETLKELLTEREQEIRILKSQMDKIYE